MTAELAARAGGPAACGGVEVEYVDPDRGRERRPLAACWSARFERVSPVRGFASFRGQRNRPGWWWFASTGELVSHESWPTRGLRGRSTRIPIRGPARRGAGSGRLEVMNTTTAYIVNAILVLMVIRQILWHRMDLRGLAGPVLAVGAAAVFFLRAVPTGGND